MFEAVESPYLVPFDGSFRVADSKSTEPVDAPKKKKLAKLLKERTKALYERQRVLYADDSRSVLLVFQAMDAAGKDSTIRAVMSGVNPAGCQVFSFKKPSSEELDHDFLWRTTKRLPERGRIGIFNRSYYEEVLVVRVHPKILDYQKLPADVDRDGIWEHRLESIRDHERHLARNGTVVLKFWLNVSKDEQKNRFLRRIDDPEKHWKFNVGDVDERERWDDYMAAYQEALTTSRPWAPWYAIPADSKPYMRYIVADLVLKNLEALDLRYPTVDEDVRARFEEMRARLG